MTLILALSTSTPRGSLALYEDGKRDDGEALAERSYDDEHHAERLFPELDALLAAAGRERADIEIVACDVGPGSFTGVRVGLASAKGIALALGLPLVGVGSLEAMAAAAHRLRSEAGALVCTMLDAKRGETFIAVYDAAGRAELEPRHIPAGSARAALGPLADDPRLSTWQEPPSALWIARIAAARPAPAYAGAMGPDTIEPVYVRAPDARPPREGIM